MREQDIRPEAIFARYLELSKADTERFFGESCPRHDVACPGCGDASSIPAFAKDSFQYCECATCATLFVSPRPSAAAFDAFYGDSPSATYWSEVFFPTSAAARREQIFVPRVAKILEMLSARSLEPVSLIDVGAGAGMFLEELRNRQPAIHAIAVEPGEKLAAVCRALGFETVQAPAEDAAAVTNSADVVVCFEVLEHVHDTLRFARALAALVKPGGHLFLSSLSVDGFDIQTLWEKSRSVAPPHHINFLSHRGFSTLFLRAGFSSVELLTPGRLDVDIVANALADNPTLLQTNRFVSRLMQRDQATRDSFQRFLADNRMSSHTWVVAKR